MQSWSKGELGIMWLGIGAALVVVAPVAFDGILTFIAVAAGVVALIYGGTVAWSGMRKSPSDDVAEEPADEPGPGSTDDSPQV